MKKWNWLTIVAVALVTGLVLTAIAAVPVLAAQLSNGANSSCAPGEMGTWHFVNNQTGGAAPGVLTATFGDVGDVGPVGPSAVNKNTQHFIIEGPAGPLLDASTNLPGRLVLSDYTCEGKATPTKEPPPKK